MRLADFILGNTEQILVEWEAFARSVPLGAKMDRLALRDHAEDILRATARDMKSAQTDTQQSDKSKGDSNGGLVSDRLDGASDLHALGRVDSGFDVMQVIAEYRALRASVVRLWRDSAPAVDMHDLADMTRFNESIDQSLTEAVRSYTKRVDRSRGMFLAILGHDLRNPLNAIMMSAALLARVAPNDKESTSVGSRISASAAAMDRLLGDLLDFTASGLGVGMPLSPVAMDLGTLCQEVVDEMRAAHPRRTIHLERHGDLAGQWDPARLRQAISNLLDNALQHGAKTGPVDLSLRGEDSDVRIAVRNEGPPISREALLTIFDPLVRDWSAESRHRRAGSIGLGLYIVREVVTAHGGDVDVNSSAAQTATTFTIRVPRCRPTA